MKCELVQTRLGSDHIPTAKLTSLAALMWIRSLGLRVWIHARSASEIQEGILR